MRNQKRLGALLAVLAALLTFAVFLYAPRASGVTRENFNRIRIGMTEEEVIAILGPPGDYRNAETEYDMSPSCQPAATFGRGNPSSAYLGSGPPLWRSDTAEVALGFDWGPQRTAQVSTGILCCARPKNDEPVGNALWRAERFWRRRLGLRPPP